MKPKMELVLGPKGYRKDVYPLLVKLAVRARRNFHAAELEDVISEGIVEALSESKKFSKNHGASVSTFLYRRVHGAMQDFMGRESKFREPLETDETAQDVINSVAGPNHMEEGQSNRNLFLEAIHFIETRLDDQTAVVIVRSYLEGNSDEQIAEEFGLKKKEVRAMRLAGLAQLRNFFASKGRTEFWVG